MPYKFSKYNLGIVLDNENTLIANTATRKIHVCKTGKIPFSEQVEYRIEKAIEMELAKKGILVKQDEDEVQKVITSYEKHKFSNNSLSVTISPTLACNMNCPYCFEKKGSSASMNSKDEVGLVQFIRNNLPGKESLDITWFGGEPLMNIGSIERISDRLIRLCSFSGATYSAGIFTNGVLLNHANAIRLKRCRISSIRIGLDGHREIQDIMRPAKNGISQFDAVIRGIKTSLDHFPQVAIGVLVGRKNSDFTPLLNLIDQHNLKNLLIHLSRLLPEETIYGEENHFGVEEYAEKEVEFARLASTTGIHHTVKSFNESGICSAGNLSHYAIDPGLRVTRCWYNINDAQKSDGSIIDGNYIPNNRDSLWAEATPFDSECKNCRFLPVCFGGCLKDRFKIPENNPSYKKDNICTPRLFNMGKLLEIEFGNNQVNQSTDAIMISNA